LIGGARIGKRLGRSPGQGRRPHPKITVAASRAVPGGSASVGRIAGRSAKQSRGQQPRCSADRSCDDHVPRPGRTFLAQAGDQRLGTDQHLRDSDRQKRPEQTGRAETRDQRTDQADEQQQEFQYKRCSGHRAAPVTTAS